MVLGQVDPESLQAACGDDPSAVCRFVYDGTESAGLAELADVFFTTGLRIVLIVVLAWVVLRLIRRAVDHFVRSLGPGEAGGTTGQRRGVAAALVPGEPSVRSAARTETLGHVLKSLAGGAIWTVAGLMVLGELGINLGPLIAGAGIAGIAIGFGAQSMVKDFLAGIFILIEDQYGVGDIVNVGEEGGNPVSGTVESVTLRSTRIRSVEGTVWHVPNGTILRVGNQSQQWARAVLDITVGYQADLDVAQSVIKRVADEVRRSEELEGKVLEEPEVWGIENLGPEGVTIRLVLKTLPAAQFEVMRKLRPRIKAALEEAGIEHPLARQMVWTRPAGADPPPGSGAEGSGKG